jgi:hypothetical protein
VLEQIQNFPEPDLEVHKVQKFPTQVQVEFECFFVPFTNLEKEFCES